MSGISQKLRKTIYRNYGKRDSFKLYRRLGLELLLNYANHIDRHLITKQPFEAEQFAFLRQEMGVESYDLFVDVGSNIGLYSLTVANMDCVDEIIAFEPDARNNCQLKSNILLNRFFNKIKVFDLGLSDTDAEVQFLQDDGRSSGHSRIEKTAPEGTVLDRYNKITIKVITFDDHFPIEDKTVYIKMDIEGHEMVAIKGMVQLFEKNRCLLQVEVFDENFEAFDKEMTGLGYDQYQSFGVDRYYKNF